MSGTINHGPDAQGTFWITTASRTVALKPSPVLCVSPWGKVLQLWVTEAGVPHEWRALPTLHDAARQFGMVPVRE